MNAVGRAIDPGPYSRDPRSKGPAFLAEMNSLVRHHAESCVEYRRILDAAFEGRSDFSSLQDLPALPVRLFKLLRLASVDQQRPTTTLRSSGTTGQLPSTIILDRDTALAQSRALAQIVTSYLGKVRRPMLIVDHALVLKERQSFSARTAGVLGFSQFGTDQTFALHDQSMEPNWNAIESFLERHRGKNIFVFGFTSIIWLHLLQFAKQAGRKLDFGPSTLIHGGGWKKLSAQNISNEDFNCQLRDQLGIHNIHNYYGMVEQTGSICMECEFGWLHVSEYSDVLIRNARTLRECEVGESGLIETLSTLPRSYPGHVLLTEDIGIVRGEDGCPCGRRGTYFSVLGRLPSAELRGCSDTYTP
jgi:phenylacetate-coenzyme A ligase PaaK-like adenylate-forming protein